MKTRAAERSARQSLREVCHQIGLIFNANGNPDQRIRNPELRAPLRAHLEVDRVRHGNAQRAVVAQVRGRHDELQAVEQVEAVDARCGLERQQATEAATEQ